MNSENMHPLMALLRERLVRQNESNCNEEAHDDEECTIITESVQNTNSTDVQKIVEKDIYVTIDKVNWTELVLANLPEEEQCKISNCPIAPTPHEKHYHCFGRSYSFIEEKYILKFLINTNSVMNAKGLKVYETMRDRGYLRNRSVMSLQNHFIKHMLPKIEFYQLPENIEPRFLELRC